MRYISAAARERARGMKFSEAVAHISRTVGCDRDCAERQLREAIYEGKVRMRWEDQPVRPQRRQPTRSVGAEAATRRTAGLEDMIEKMDELTGPVPGPNPIREWPPQDALFWQRTPIRNDMVLDPFTLRERVLLLLRSDLRRIWSKRLTAATQPVEGSVTKRGRPRELRYKVTKLLLEYNVDLTMTKKEVLKWVREHWGGTKPPSDRTIVRAIKAAKEDEARGQSQGR